MNEQPTTGNGYASEEERPRKSSWQKLKSALGFRSRSSLKESLEEVMEEHEGNGVPIEEEERQMIQNVLSFSELTVENVMVPRSDIVALDYEASFEEVKQCMLEKQHTRVPVYRHTLDDIAGFIHIKDVLRVLAEKTPYDMEAMIRQALFVPPSMKISGLLVKMQLSRVHIAIVVDEYGGTAGMLTMEDVMEEIVGEIEDEHDVEQGELFMQTGRNRFEALARIEVPDLEDHLGMKLRLPDKEEDYETLGGLLFTLLGRVPTVGEVTALEFDEEQKLEFEILEADARRIKRVMIIRRVNPAAQNAA